MATPKRVSNNIDNFLQGGGLYPGGSGKVTDISYVLWDYGGTQPKDSVFAVLMKFQPTDGSGEGKEQEIHWSAGKASDFQPSPDGAYALQVGMRESLADNSNWAEVLKALVNTCGMESSKLDGDSGIRALIDSNMTISRVDQKEREGLEDTTLKSGQTKVQKRKMYLPTRCTFAWDKSGGGRPSTSASGPSAASKATMGQKPAESTEAPDASSILSDVLISSGGSILVAAIGKALLDNGTFKTLGRKEKMDMMADIKTNLETIASASNWSIEDGKLLLN